MRFWILASAALAIAGASCNRPAPGAQPAPSGQAATSGQAAASGNAASGPLASGGAAVHRACKEDIAKFCAGTQPGPDRAQCMRQHKDELSADCKAARMNARAARGGQSGPSHG
ncbi:MAG TPA: cysteine rich repeat-containing protein [Caulobacteraceae bacterium]